MSTLSEISERESSPAAAATNYSAVGGAAAGSQHEALKRPSLFSVLVGSHLSVCANEGMQLQYTVCGRAHYSNLYISH